MPVIHLVRRAPVFGMPAVPAGLRIRPLCPLDAAGVAMLAVSQQALPAGPRPTVPGLEAELSGRRNREIAGWVAVPDSVDDGSVLGLATLATSRGKVGCRQSIAWLLVHPSARRQGLGRALVETIFHETWNRDQPEIWIECHTAWRDAIEFWKRIGFTARDVGPPSSTG